MIEVIQADITSLQVDAIVNAANPTLLGGGGVDGAIHRAAGPELKLFCATLGGCPTGGARISPGFRLRAKYVIHAVGPVWSGGQANEARLLESCYRSAFALAVEQAFRTLAFPSISTGAYGYPKEQAAPIAIAVMRSYAKQFDRIIACCFSETDRRLYKQILSTHPRPGG